MPNRIENQRRFFKTSIGALCTLVAIVSLASCGDPEVAHISDSAIIDSLGIRVYTDPHDIDLKRVSRFLGHETSGGKVYLIPLDSNDNPTNEVLVLDASEVTTCYPDANEGEMDTTGCGAVRGEPEDGRWVVIDDQGSIINP